MKSFLPFFPFGLNAGHAVQGIWILIGSYLLWFDYIGILVYFIITLILFLCGLRYNFYLERKWLDQQIDRYGGEPDGED